MCRLSGVGLGVQVDFCFGDHVDARLSKLTPDLLHESRGLIF